MDEHGKVWVWTCPVCKTERVGKIGWDGECYPCAGCGADLGDVRPMVEDHFLVTLRHMAWAGSSEAARRLKELEIG